MGTIKKIMLLSAFVISSFSVFAQDTIVNSEQNKYNVKNQQISPVDGPHKEMDRKSRGRKSVYQCNPDSGTNTVIVSEKDKNGTIVRKKYNLIEK